MKLYLMLILFAGFPPTISPSATSLTTTARAATTALAPTSTPGPKKESAQIHASSPIDIGGLINGMAGSLKS